MMYIWIAAAPFQALGLLVPVAYYAILVWKNRNNEEEEVEVSVLSA